MTLSGLEEFYFSKEEPLKSTLIFLRDHLLKDDNMEEQLKWSLPFFSYQGKSFCYFWIDKKSGFPYIGMVRGSELTHPILEQGDRKKMKILRLDPNQDLPLSIIDDVLTEAKALYD